MFFKSLDKDKMPDKADALPGRAEAMPLGQPHYVLNTEMRSPYPEGYEKILVGMGCFWGAEKAFWSLPGIYTTAVGYSAGYTPNPTYEEICTGKTDHTEVVLIVFNPDELSLNDILKVFWESHNPTQGMRQGNDLGTQYRSGIYVDNDMDKQQAEASKLQYQASIDQQLGAGSEAITTEIMIAEVFYFAEQYHQQYLAKNPNGYCGLGGMGVCFK